MKRFALAFLAVFLFTPLLAAQEPSISVPAELLEKLPADPDAKAVVLGTGYGFCEGPAVDPVGNIYFSDGAKDAIHFYAYGREVQLFTDKTTDANGMMFNPRGELVVCEGAAFQVVAIDTRTGNRRVLAKDFEGERFNEPNDLSIDEHGGFYFTDPNYKHRKQETVRKEDTYYCSAEGEITRVSTVCKKPNGVLLSADGKTLYLADNGDACVYAYDVTGPGKLENERLFAKLGGGPDGMTMDVYGNLYIACGGKGVEVYGTLKTARKQGRFVSPGPRGPGAPMRRGFGGVETVKITELRKEGKLLGVLGKDHGIDYASNCVFGGPGNRMLYITAADKFLGIRMNVPGMAPVCAKVSAP